MNMTTKKKTSKAVKATVVVPAFNKKNAVAFGESIFSTKGGMITCVKLCDGSLQDGKDGSKTMHCAVGEAYATFVNPSLRSVLRKDDLSSGYDGKYSGSDGSTGAAIDALVETAKLKKNDDASRRALGAALEECVNTNDDTDHSDYPVEVAQYISRAQQVARTWNEKVVPLLK
jgi:hypothetical protein